MNSFKIHFRTEFSWNMFWTALKLVGDNRGCLLFTHGGKRPALLLLGKGHSYFCITLTCLN